MNGIINLNKPKGITSQQAVTKVRKLFGAKKAGHAGTLDPMATGVLLICLDEATKIMRFLIDKDKRYSATIQLGTATDTQDADGAVIETRDVPQLTYEDVIGVVAQFIGEISQVPPMYSALKLNGEPLYKLARKGLEVQRESRLIEIYDIQVKQVNLPYINIDVYCSKGTYIRTLCEDIGKKLGTCAHLSRLERTMVGALSIDTAISLESLEKKPLIDSSCLLSVDDVLSEMPEVVLDENEYVRALNGSPVQRQNVKDLTDGSFVKLRNPYGHLFGFGSINGAKIAVKRILKM